MLTARLTIAATVAALALLPAGCGGDDDGGGSASSGGAARSGQQIFSDTCGGCHTLAAADTGGQIGPNLDDLKPSRDRVLNAIRTGPSAMPPNLLEGAEAQKVADFVSQNAGR